VQVTPISSVFLEKAPTQKRALGRSWVGPPAQHLVDLPPAVNLAQKRSPADSVSCGANKENLTTHQPNTEVLMRATSADTIRNLVNAIPEQRLRRFVVEIAASALRCLMPGIPELATTIPPVSTDKTRRHWSQARRAAHNAKRREKRAAAAAGARRRRRRSKAPGEANMPIGNGATANGVGAVSATALWKHAAKLEPKAPWRAVVRELGVNEGAAQAAHRNGTLPSNISPVAATRFLAL
jgi:hypothetical protein